jgi:MHS family proline/betaine transporter-like MFS transporter
MTTGALFVAVLPSLFYFSLLTPMLLLLIPLIHNLSAGGETPGTVTYLYETFPKKTRPFALSWVNFGFFLGVFLSTVDFSSLYWELKQEQFLNWGWRIPFLFSAFIGFLGLFFRKKLHETPQFNYSKTHHTLFKNPFKILFKDYKKQILLGTGLLTLHTISINILVIFNPSYFQTYLGRSPDETLTLCIFSVMIGLLTAPLAGYISLKIEAKKLLHSLTLLLIILALPLYKLLQTDSMLNLFFASALLTCITSAYSSLIPGFVCDLFPSTLRCSGYSASSNILIALLTGVVPPLLSWLITSKGLMLSPGYAIIIAATISSISLFMLNGIKKPNSEKNQQPIKA